MKSIAIFLILSIITLTTSKIDLDNYSINMFIFDLKNKGLFEVIQSIKYFYGQDIAIISCEEININRCGNCKKVVTDYMPIYDKLIEDKKKPKSIQEILSKKFSPKETKLIYERIMKRNKKAYNFKKKIK